MLDGGKKHHGRFCGCIQQLPKGGPQKKNEEGIRWRKENESRP